MIEYGTEVVAGVTPGKEEQNTLMYLYSIPLQMLLKQQKQTRL